MQVDIEKRGDLVEQLDVLHVPTLVLVIARKVVARIDGRASAPKIEAMLEQHLLPTAAPA
jgi:thioredoxin-like negative regulator of GroEL